jgi:hypothetical protein
MEIQIINLEGKTTLGGRIFCLFIDGDGSANDMWPDSRHEAGLCIHEVLQYIGNALQGKYECDTCTVCFEQ